MNIRTQYKKTLLTTLLVTTFLVLPHAVLAQDVGAAEGFFQGILWSILVTITGTILWICAMLFDFSVNVFVIGFGDLFLGSGIGVAVDRIWFILRDFVNMFFIFGLVYIGFKMILDADNSNTRRWLVNLIIAAVLINFSLFITKAVVDFSNNIATQIAISGFPQGSGESVVGTPKVDLADNLLGLLGVKDLLTLNVGTNPGGGWGYIFGTAIFFLVTAFVLAAGAFMLMIRFIALTLFLLVSPLMFVSWVLPPVSDTMKKYWKMFLGRAFFAPVYFLFLYFSLETLVGLQESLGISSGGGKWANTFATTGAAGNTALANGQSTLPFFFIMCGFMIGSLVIAKKIGADGADGALSLGKSLKNKAIGYTKKGAGAATLGVGARVGRSTIGRGANAMANSSRLQNWAAKSRVGRAALGATRGVADSSFDARQVAGVGKTLGIGEGKKGGFTTRIKERKEKDEKFMDSLSNTDTTTDANKKRVQDLADEKSVAATQEINDANSTKIDAENESEAIAARRENEGKSEEELTKEIDNLAEQIVALNVVMKKRTDEGTLTTQEKAGIENELEKRRVSLRSKGLAKEDVVRQNALTNQINQAKTDEGAATDPAQQAIHRERRQQLVKELAAHKDLNQREVKVSEALIKAKEDIEKAEEVRAKALTDATNEIKFERKLAFLETAKQRATGGMTFNGTFNAKEQASLENLQKKFGANASQMYDKAAKSTEEKNLLKNLTAAMKENAPKEKPAGA
jgi:hypothetical protein